MNIRAVAKGDSEQLLELFEVIDNESQFMMLEPGERSPSLEQQEEHIEAFSNSLSKTMLIAVDEANNNIIGFIVGDGGQFQRNKHSLYCIIGIRQAYAGRGLGRTLMTQLEQWAVKHCFHRLELTVMEHNSRAIKLYTACGFEVEGTKRHSLRVDNQFINELSMSKLLAD